ncbi:hypothetical protein SAMN05444166_6403 [Singulisphaera sp. GP187]|uniref:hypothetical protein n=1 Tax=Singulisphaera sp. GP187 TaxID=1882752 RepID=UPI000929D77D|nr:hypothetical protein [Singulisphaera sp. GP187]SIO60468.1 hypothetical protein SAMN05444166_6403 [Singulisphaera sp. GP187]
MAPLRDKKATARRGRLRVESLEDRVLLAEMAAWVGQNNTDYVGRDGLSPDGYQDIDIHLFGLDPSRAIDRVEVQRQYGGLWTATSSLSSQALLVRSQTQATGAWSTEADVYLEPYFNDPANTRYEAIRIKYADGTLATINNLLSTSSVNVQLRVQGKDLGVIWAGQDGPDLTGPGPSAGSDGIKDIHLKLTNLLDYRRATDGGLSTFNVDTDTVIVSMPTADGSTVNWLAGPRPTGMSSSYNRAEIFLDPSDPSRADVYLNPVAGLGAGSTVTVTVGYNRIGKMDASPNLVGSASQLVATIATTPDPTLAASASQDPSIPVSFSGPSALWSRQDNANTNTPGFVHITLSGLPAGWSMAEAVLSDDIGWVWTPGDLNSAKRLTIRPLADPTKADLIFAPIRDESDALMSLRFRLAGGTVQYVSQFRGGVADPNLRDPAPLASSITVDPASISQPGQDLNSLAKRYGTIHLKAGVYALSAPIDLVNSIALIADPGAIFSFSQASADPAWSYAIKIHKSHTTLDGLSIRFATPIRWTTDFQMNPAVIGSAYSDSNFGPNPKVDLNFRNLNIDYSPQGSAIGYYNLTVVRLIRGNYDDSGVIANNVFRGGPVELWGGPWTITGNDYRGASAGTSVSPVFAIRYSHDILLEGNHAHQVDPAGITYGFLLFTGTSSNTTVRNNVIDGGIGRDAAVNPGGQYNLPELILTESYYPHYEGPAIVSPVSRRLLKVGTLRGTPGEPGDIVAILSGPSAGRWFRIAQTIDPQNYLLDGDLPAGDYTISITRGFVNDVYEGNTIDTSSLQKSSSIAFQLAGTHVGTLIRNNLVIGAQPFSIAASATQEAWQGSTAYPAPWGWSHSPVFDLTIDGNTFRDPVFWTLGSSPAGATRTVAQGVLTVEHSTNIQENRGRLYLSGSVTDNQFIYSDALVAATTGNFTSLQIGDPTSIDPGELRLTQFSGNSSTTSPAFVQAGRKVGFQFLAGNLAGQVLEPPQSPAATQVTAVSHNQDGSDFVGRSATTAPDGLQDVHIVLAGLRTDLAIQTIDIYPYGGGHYQYATTGLPANTPGLTPGAWRIGVVRSLLGPSRFAATADLYVQPYAPISATSHYDILITYANGLTASLPLFGVVVADPSLRVNSGPATVTATSLGQDNSDFVGYGTTLAPDGYQDIHIVLAGLPSNKAIAQVDVLPYGYGHYQYVAPLPTSLPTQINRSSWIWRAALVRDSLGLGTYSTTADLYVPSLIPENGIQKGTNSSNHYDLLITYADGSTSSTVAWGVVGDPSAKVVGLAAKSYGQDGADFVGPTPAPQSDGIQDLHLGLTGLRTDLQVSQVDVWAVGGGSWTYQGSAYQSAVKLVRASNGPGSYAPTGDLYLAPNSSFLGADGTLIPQTLQILVRYADGSTSAQTQLTGVLADPRLLNPVATSLNQDGHDLARLAASSGSDGKQDVHVVLSNLPTTTPVARVVVRRLGSGGSYLSDGSTGSWMAVFRQPQTGPATYASAADLYFEPDPSVHDVNQSYQIDVYFGDTASRPLSLLTTITATPGLAMPSAAPNTTLQVRSVSAAATLPQAFATTTATVPLSTLTTSTTTTSVPAPLTAVPTPSPATAESSARKIPLGPLGHPHRKGRHVPTPSVVSTPHQPAANLGAGHKAAAALKASIRRHRRSH